MKIRIKNVSTSMSMPMLKQHHLYKEQDLADVVSEGDLSEIAERLNVDVSNLYFSYSLEPIEKFEAIKDTPKDENVLKIVKNIRRGHTLHPLFVYDNKIIEGHHRLRAFYNVGLKEVPVLTVTFRTTHEN